MAVYYLLWTCCVALRGGDSAPLPSDTVRRFARSFPRQEFRVLECEMTRLGLLLCYFSVELLSFVCRAHGKSGQHLGSIVVVSGSNGSKDGEHLASDPPPTAEKCRGYFDVMGQWDPPFNCSTGAYLFCCGTCGFRYCCQFRSTRLDQDICKNYDTPVWLMTGRPPSKRNDLLHDHTRDKTNLIVYIVCGVVAVMVLVGIFTKLGLEKAHRPHRENMSRFLADWRLGRRWSEDIRLSAAPLKQTAVIGVSASNRPEKHLWLLQKIRPSVLQQSRSQRRNVVQVELDTKQKPAP
ncbi:SHSA9 protein, partial [Polypterus senegalus]